MVSLVGVVSSRSYSIYNNYNNYIINFNLLVDRKIYIWGEIKATYISNKNIIFHAGEKIIIEGNLYLNNGLNLKVNNYQILPLL